MKVFTSVKMATTMKRDLKRMFSSTSDFMEWTNWKGKKFGGGGKCRFYTTLKVPFLMSPSKSVFIAACISVYLVRGL